MARFKDKDVIILTNEEALFGDAQEASIKYDGSDLVTDQVLKHSTQGYFATQEFVTDAIAALEWQDAVISMTTDIPGAPNYEDRYIIPTGATGAWSGLDDTVAEYITTWVYTTPSAGFAMWVVDEGSYFVYSGSTWVRLGTVVDHTLLENLDVDDHTQYLLAAGTRSLTGDWDAGAHTISTLTLHASGTLTVTSSADIGHDAVISRHMAVGPTANIDIPGFPVYERVINVSKTFDASITNAYGLNVAITGTADAGTAAMRGVSVTANHAGVEANDIRGINASAYTSAPSADVNTIYGLWSKAYIGQDYSTVDTLIGGLFDASSVFSVVDINSTDVIAGKFAVLSSGTGDYNVTNTYGIQVAKPGASFNGTFTNLYGIYIEDMSSTSINFVNDYNIYSAGASSKNYFEGNMDIGGDLTVTGNITGGNFNLGDVTAGDIDAVDIVATGSITASANFYGDGSNLTGMLTDHGLLDGLDDDDHLNYFPADGSRPITGTLTVNTTGGFMRFSGITAEIGVSTNTDLLYLDATGMIIDGNLTVSGDLSGGDHGLLEGLADDDHSQYLNTARHDTTARHGAASVDHGLIDGLADDDHPQYFLNNAATNLTTTGYVSAAEFYGDGSSLTNLVVSAAGIDHGHLLDLGADDHPQYALVNGTRDFTGKVTINSGGENTPLKLVSTDSGCQIEFEDSGTTGYCFIGCSSDDVEIVCDNVAVLRWDADGLGIDVNTSDCVLDQDNMASNDAKRLATQQSIKAYVDAVTSLTLEASANAADVAMDYTDSEFTTHTGAADPHTGYLLADGSRDLSGSLSVSGNINAGGNLAVDSVTLTDNSGNLAIDSNIELGDNDGVIFGAGSDGKIYSDGDHFLIDALTNNLYLRVNSTENAIECVANAGVTLNYDSGARLATTTGGITVTGTTNITSTPASDETASGTTTTMNVTGNTVGFGSALYMTSGGEGLDEADADWYATMPCRVLALETGTGQDKSVLLKGFIRDDSWTWTPGLSVYVSTTVGTLTQTPPAGSGDQVQTVGWAHRSNILYFDPDSTVVEIA